MIVIRREVFYNGRESIDWGKWVWSRIDREIIKMLQRNARTPLKAIAQEVHLSIPAVSARVERMEREHVICGYTMLAGSGEDGIRYHRVCQYGTEAGAEGGILPFYTGD